MTAPQLEVGHTTRVSEAGEGGGLLPFPFLADKWECTTFIARWWGSVSVSVPASRCGQPEKRPCADPVTGKMIRGQTPIDTEIEASLHVSLKAHHALCDSFDPGQRRYQIVRCHDGHQ